MVVADIGISKNRLGITGDRDFCPQWFAGRAVASVFATFGKYVAAVLVFAIGIKMCYEALKSHPGLVAEAAEHTAEKELHIHPADPTRGLSLILLSIATSIDALVVGFSLALSNESIWQASIIIGLVAALMALMGVAIGKQVGRAFGRWAELAGAFVLMGLGISFLLC